MSQRSIVIFILFFILLFASLMFSQDKIKQTGINHINAGEYRQAIEELEKVILRNPQDAEALFYLGVAYRNLGSGQLKNALSGISQALKIRPNDPNWQYELARTYDDMDKFGISLTDTNKTTYELAVEGYKKVVELQDKFLEAHLSLGEIYLRNGKYELASEKFKDVIKIDPENESSYSYLADCLCKLDRYDEAITNLNKWSNINANKIEPHNLKAKIYWYQGKYENAQREYQKVIDLDTTNQLARARLDSIIIIIQNKNRINELLARGELLLNERQYELAIIQFEEIRKIDPNHSIANERLREARTRLSDYWFNKGLQRVRNNDLDGAVENFNRALQYVQSPKQMNKIMQQWQEAQKTLGEQAQMYKLRKRGENYILEKEYSLAKEYLNIFDRESRTSEPDVKVALDTLEIAALYKIAISNEMKGNWIEALTFYKEVFGADSNYKDVNFRIAKVYADFYYEGERWGNAKKYYSLAKNADLEKSKIKEIPYNKSVVERLIVVSNRQKVEKLERVVKIVIITSMMLLIGIFFGIYGHVFFVKNKERVLSFRNSFISFFTFKNVLFLLICISIIITIYFYGNELPRLLSSIPSKLRSLIYWPLFAIIIAVILTICPKYVITTFNVNSEKILFDFLPQNKNSRLFINKVIDSRVIKISDIKCAKLKISSMQELSSNSELLVNKEICVRPWSENVNLNVLVKGKANKNIGITSIILNSQEGFLFDKDKNSIFVNFTGNKELSKNTYDEDNIIEIDPEFQLILDKCCIFDGKEMRVIDKKTVFNISSENNHCQIIHFTAKNPSQIEMQFDENFFSNPFIVLNDLQGEGVSFFNNLSSLKTNNTFSSIIKGDIHIPLKEVKKENLNKGDVVLFQPQRYEKFDMIIDKTGFLVNFNSKIRSLKFGRHRLVNNMANQIPVLLEWLIFHKRSWALILFFIGWLIVFIIQPYLESFFSKLP